MHRNNFMRYCTKITSPIYIISNPKYSIIDLNNAYQFLGIRGTLSWNRTPKYRHIVSSKIMSTYDNTRDFSLVWLQIFIISCFINSIKPKDHDSIKYLFHKTTLSMSFSTRIIWRARIILLPIVRIKVTNTFQFG